MNESCTQNVSRNKTCVLDALTFRHAVIFLGGGFPTFCQWSQKNVLRLYSDERIPYTAIHNIRILISTVVFGGFFFCFFFGGGGNVIFIFG